MRHRCCIFFFFRVALKHSNTYTILHTTVEIWWTPMDQGASAAKPCQGTFEAASTRTAKRRPVGNGATLDIMNHHDIMTYHTTYHNMTNWYLSGRSIFIHESSIFIASCHTALCLPWFPLNAPPASGWMGRSPKTCQTEKNHLENFPGDPKTQENWALWFTQKAFKDWYFEEFWENFRLTTSRLTCAPRGRTSNSLRWQLRPLSRSIDCSCRRTWEAPNFGIWEV